MNCHKSLWRSGFVGLQVGNIYKKKKKKWEDEHKSLKEQQTLNYERSKTERRKGRGFRPAHVARTQAREYPNTAVF